jgi:hypothetical protein
MRAKWMQRSAAAIAAAAIVIFCGWRLPAAAGSGPVSGPVARGEEYRVQYRVLDPIQSGDLTLYPIAQVMESAEVAHWRYLTLDEGLRSGDVVIEEAGKARGLVRHRPSSGSGSGSGAVYAPPQSGDQVNTLVLVNNSSLPLVLLAGEIVTGGKQDRIIAKDRIVPPNGEPLDLSVFCIEPGRWTEKTAVFHGASAGKLQSFMVEPSVRSQAMIAEDQQQVWNAVNGAIAETKMRVQAEAAPGGGNADIGSPARRMALPATTSYAETMASSAAAVQVDKAAELAVGANNEIAQRLLKQRAVGVVAAIRGHIVWADVFATPEMLAAYWTKLVRSYAAESLHTGAVEGPAASREEALKFLSSAVEGHETSEGTSQVYEYKEIRGTNESLFVLRALAPGSGGPEAGFDVHRTKAYARESTAGMAPPRRGTIVY